MENVPDHGAHEVRVVIDPEDAVVRITGQGCCIVLEGVERMREVRDSLSAHIGAVEAEQRERGTAELGRLIPPYGAPVGWFDTGSGPGWEVRES